jgi:hypothetical protein
MEPIREAWECAHRAVTHLVGPEPIEERLQAAQQELQQITNPVELPVELRLSLERILQRLGELSQILSDEDESRSLAQDMLGFYDDFVHEAGR